MKPLPSGRALFQDMRIHFWFSASKKDASKRGSFHTCYFLILRKIMQLDLDWEVKMFSSHFMLQVVILASQTCTRAFWSSGCFSGEAFSCINYCYSHENFSLICFLIYPRASVEAAGCFKTQWELLLRQLSQRRQGVRVYSSCLPSASLTHLNLWHLMLKKKISPEFPQIISPGFSPLSSPPQLWW